MRKLVTLLCLLGTAGFIFAQTVPEILYYKFDGTGTTVPNEASAPPTGTATANIVGSLSQGGTGLCGTGLVGVGGSSSSNYVNTGWNTALGTGSWTLMFWHNNIPSSSTLFYQFGDASASSFRCFNNGAAGAGNWLLRGPVTDVSCTGCAPVGNDPRMTTFVYDAVAGNIKAYSNTTLINTVSQPSLNINGSQFKVGGYSGSTGMGSGEIMDEFRFYDRPLDINEITLVYNQCLPLSSAPDDAGISNLVSPVNFCPDTNDVVVTLKNFGTDTLSSCVINWSVDGVTQTPVTFNGNPALDTLGGVNPTDTNITLGTFYFAPNTPYDIVAWTTMPNGVTDTVNYNDTLMVTVQGAISGNLTIGGPGADYATFTDAVNDLNTFGVCGPTVFSVYDTVYNEQFNIGDVSGTSSTNTITFQAASGDPLVQFYAISSTANYVLGMTGGDWITFDNIDFMNTGITYGHVMEMNGGSHWNTFMNCDFVGDTTPTTTSTNMVVLYSNTSVDSGNKFINNLIRGGSYGTYLYGDGATGLEPGTVFEGNHVVGNYYMGIRMYYQDACKIKDNWVEVTTPYTGSFYRFYLVNLDNDFEVTGNTAYGGGYGYGMYMSGCDATSSRRGLVANNAVYVGNPASTSTSYGLYLTSCGFVDIVGNSFLMESNGTSSRSLYLTGGGANEVYNNIFMTLGPGYAAYIASAFSAVGMDHNNLYAPTGITGYFNGNTNTLLDWQNASGFDANGWSVDPQFASMSDFHVCNDTLDGAGMPHPGMMVDFDGDMRDTLMPDIGADEFTPLVAGFLGPDLDLCTGDSVAFTVGAPGDAVSWSTGATTRTIWINTPGTYTVDVSGICGTGSDTIVINQSALVYSGFLSADTLTACDGDSIMLMGDSGYAYSWSTGETSQNITVTATGTYTLDVTDACGSGSDTISVNFISAPTANFTHSTSFLTGIFTDGSTSGGGNASYSWDFGDGSSGSTLKDPVHVFPMDGQYVVTLTVTNECGSDTYTDTVNVIVVGMATQLDENTVTVFPNPAEGAVNVSMNIGNAEEVSIELLNAQGIRILSRELQTVSGQTDLSLDLSDVAAGLYFVKVSSGDSGILKKLVIQ